MAQTHKTNAGAIAGAAAAAILMFGPVAAQAESLPAADNFVFWPADQIPAGYRHMEKIFGSEPVRRGARTTPLPKGAPLKVTYQQDGASKTVDDYMSDNHVAALVVLHHGKVVLERYAQGQTPRDEWTSNSVAKSFTSTLVGAAIKDGKIGGVDDLMVKYLPELQGGAFANVTIRQVLLMSSGVKWSEDYGDRNADSSVIRNIQYPGSTARPVDIAAYMSQLPHAFEPGTQFSYNSGNPHLLGVLLQRVTGKSLPAYLSEKIWAPAGMEADASVLLDRSGRAMGSCCLNARPRDFARFGLWLSRGAPGADGASVLPAGWLDEATRPVLPTKTKGVSYGYQWWIHADGSYRAVGIFGQTILVAPKRDLVVVEMSAWPKATWPMGAVNRGAFTAGLDQALAAQP